MDAPRALLLILALAVGHVAAAAAAAAAQTVDQEWTSLGAARQLLDTVSPNSTQFSGHLDGSVSPSATDFPLDSGPLARTATGWEPEGVHLTLWGPDAVLVSWQTGEPRTGPTSDPPAPYDAAEVEGLVRYGTAPDQLNQTATDGKNAVYSYAYNEAAGGMTYHSPILHHVLLTELQPGQQYWYRVGGRLANGSAAPEGREWSFRLPAGPPAELRIGVLGDPGQTSNTSQNLALLAEAKPDVVFILGDLTYADLYYSNQTNSNWSFTAVPASQQLRWDSWARLTEPLLATVPAVLVGGNHEAELQPDVPGHPTFTAFNARYPQPQNRDSIETAPNLSDFYLNASNSKQFVNTSDYLPANAFFSHQLPWLNVIALNNYLPYDPASPQYRWAAAELEAVNRTETPWLVVLMHGSPRTTYAESWGLWKELEGFMSFYEPLFYEAGVDMVLSGHVHSYERSLPMFNYSVDPCGVQYISVGDGGNTEGPETAYVDEKPPPYCSNISAWEQAKYQPTLTGLPTVTLQNGSFCPDAQPPYSAFRDPSFGHGLLVIRNATAAEWSWQRNQDGQATPMDRVTSTFQPGVGSTAAAEGRPARRSEGRASGMAEVSCCGEALDRAVCGYLEHSGQASEVPPDEVVRRLIADAGDFGGAAERLASLCPALAENQWLQFQLKRHNFLLLAARATAPTSGGGGADSPEARAHQLQQALELARRELAPLALHAYCEAYSDFKHCMLALLSGGTSGAEAQSELRQFAGMVARALRQELAAGGGAAPSSPPQLLQLLRYLLLLHQHQHHGGFHPYWWPKVSSASQALCSRLLLPGRDALPPPELDTGAQDSFGGLPPGVRETDVQALRTSLGCDREEAVTLLRRARGSASRALQDALQAVHIDEQLLRQLAEEYAACRGLEPLPASSSAAEGSEEEMQTDAQQAEVQPAAPQQAASPGKAERARKAGMKRSAAAAEGEAEAGGGPALELPAELSEHQLRRVMRRLEHLLSAGQADEALRELEAADPAFLPDHPAAAFALHRCRFLQQLSAGGGTAAALAVVRQDLSPLAQREPELQPQLKAALALLLPLPAAGGGGGDAAALKRQQQGMADALAALRAALRPRCHVREPQLLSLLRELLSLHQAHFKLQRCQDRFAAELGLSALKASAPTAPSTVAAPAAAAPAAATSGMVEAALAAAAAEAQELLAAAGQVPVPGVRELTSESEGDEMEEDSEEEEFAEDGAGVPESAIVTVCEFTGLPRHTAIELLLVHGGDPASVLAQMFP